jgi:membrane associated rhomboid family serine protease
VSLNHILLFLAVASPLLVLARAWRPGGVYRGWRIAAIVVLAITGASWIMLRSAAGYIGGGAWFALLFLPAVGLRKMTVLAEQGNYKSAAKLGAALHLLHPSPQLRDRIQVFRQLGSDHDQRVFFQSPPIEHEIAQQQRRRHFRHAPAVFTFILLNAAAFLFENSVGSSTDPEVLHQIGALEPYAVILQGQYWRLFTSLFLHAGVLHLLFNLFALYVLGPPLERSIGSLRFGVCYLISGLLSGAGVLFLTVIGLVQVAQLVGASGCIMGIVGAWAGFLLRHRQAPHAKQRLVNVLMIVGIQTAFDLSTPQVSLAAHLCGLIAGFFLGLVLSPRLVETPDEPS